MECAQSFTGGALMSSSVTTRAIVRMPASWTRDCARCSLVVLQYGMEFAAQHILPLLTPLLTVQQLSNAQFARFLKLIMDILT